MQVLMKACIGDIVKVHLDWTFLALTGQTMLLNCLMGYTSVHSKTLNVALAVCNKDNCQCRWKWWAFCSNWNVHVAALDHGHCRLLLAVSDKDNCPCRWQRWVVCWYRNEKVAAAKIKQRSARSATQPRKRWDCISPYCTVVYDFITNKKYK